MDNVFFFLKKWGTSIVTHNCERTKCTTRSVWYVRLTFLNAYKVYRKAQTEQLLVLHPSFWMLSACDKGSPVRRLEVKGRVSHHTIVSVREISSSWIFIILKWSSQSFLIKVYHIHFKNTIHPSILPFSKELWASPYDDHIASFIW